MRRSRRRLKLQLDAVNYSPERRRFALKCRVAHRLARWTACLGDGHAAPGEPGAEATLRGYASQTRWGCARTFQLDRMTKSAFRPAHFR